MYLIITVSNSAPERQIIYKQNEIFSKYYKCWYMPDKTLQYKASYNCWTIYRLSVKPNIWLS